MTPDAHLTLTDVSHAYGDFVAARRVHLAVRAGEVACLLGPSGSGKSTLLRLVAGLEHLQEGRITIGGVEVAAPGVHVRPEHRSVGFVFQDYALFPHLDVLNNVGFGMPKVPKGRRRDTALELLRRVGMENWALSMPHTLSGGQQQRVALARALARKPGIMLLDEPFSGLDTRLREEVRGVTLEALRSAGVATLMVTHDPREALSTGDRISVIRHGKIVQSGTPDEVYHRSTSREVAETFGSVNVLSGTVRDGRVSTVLGDLDADGTEGSTVELLLRPEALGLHRSPGPERVAGRVLEVFPEGGTVRVRLAVDGGVELTALALAQNAWHGGDDIFVALDRDRVMVC